MTDQPGTSSRPAPRPGPGSGTLSRWWISFILRLLSCAAMGHAVLVTVRVVCIDGEPKFWSRPDVMPIEPASRADSFEAFLEGMGGKK